MKIIRLTEQRPEEETAKLAGRFLDRSHYHTVLTEDADVFKPDGSPLIKFRKAAIDKKLCAAAFPVFREAATRTDNRGMASGLPDPDRPDLLPKELRGRVIYQEGKTRVAVIKKDGTKSNVSRAVRVNSGIVGYFDRSSRFPYCRLTAYNINHPERFAAVLPYIKRVDDIFKEALPDRYDAQIAVVKATNPDFYISGTSFTTLTVNKNFRTAVHKDVGDLKAGFGVMSALRAGKFQGCYTCFPAFGVAVDMHTGDVLMADVHEWHGNTEMNGKIGKFERISLVFYYREGMAECGSAEEELSRAKQLRSPASYAQ